MYIEKSGLQESNTLTNVSCTYAGEGGKVLPGLTDYLKGLGIMAVMVNHFYNNYIGNTYEGYANGFIAVFFGLSGYGIYHSLNRLTYSIDTAKAALSYYLKRALRIYPLYFIVAGLYCLKDGFNLPIIFGLGSPRWFVSAILACYIVSFPLFILQKKWGTISFILFTAAGIALMNAFDSFAGSYMGFFSLFFPKYRGVYFGYVLIFSSGMIMPQLLWKWKTTANVSLIKLILASVVFWAAIHFTRENNLIAGCFFILATFIFIFTFLLANPKVWGKKIVCLIGNYSYSIYLFHVFYYKALEKIGLIKIHTPWTAVYPLLFFPLFLAGCVLLEKNMNKSVKKLLFIGGRNTGGN